MKSNHSVMLKLLLLLILLGSSNAFVSNYKKLGDGWCRPAGCNIKDSSCRVSGFWKDETSKEQCHSMCSNVSCGAFASSFASYYYPNRCYIYGAGISRAGWNSYPQMETVATQTNGAVGVECFVRSPAYTFSIDGNGLLKYGSGYVCDDGFEANEAEFVCRVLGHDDPSFSTSQHVSGSFSMDDLDCPSGASSLSKCTFTTQHDCVSHEGIRLTCETFSIDGNGLLKYGSGYVCDDGFGANEAEFVCRVLGHDNPSFSTSQHVSGSFSLDDLDCPSGASSLLQCTFTTQHDCGSQEGIRLTCEKFSIDGNGLLKYGSGYVCDDGFEANEAEFVCRVLGHDDASFSTSQHVSGSFSMDNLDCPSGASSLSKCTFTNTNNCQSHEGIRLTCKTFSIDGNGLLKYGSGYVCDDGFGANEAEFVCRVLGHDGASFSTSQHVSGSFSMDNLDCPSGASSLSQCTFTTQHDCGSHEGIRLTCGSSG